MNEPGKHLEHQLTKLSLTYTSLLQSRKFPNLETVSNLRRFRSPILLQYFAPFSSHAEVLVIKAETEANYFHISRKLGSVFAMVKGMASLTNKIPPHLTSENPGPTNQGSHTFFPKMSGVITRRHFLLVGREFSWTKALKLLLTTRATALNLLMN